MKITDTQKLYGAALTQVIGHMGCESINPVFNGGAAVFGEYQVNSKIGLHCKYAMEPTTGQYFTFNYKRQNLADIALLDGKFLKSFQALVCVAAEEICCLSYAELMALVEERRKAKGGDEEQYTIYVAAQPNQGFKVMVVAPSSHAELKSFSIPFNAFPRRLFE